MKEVAEEQDFVKDITKMSVDFDRWYTDVVRKAELADWSGVRGMMVVRPYGWAMWEAITRAFDDMIKESGHENWAFPLLIPREYLMKEAEHVEGFAPEVAWVTRAGAGMEELEEPLAIRPTSESIVGPLIKRYIQSHRDLPKLTNQWNNVLRWEMRSRLFLRTREFFWQEGHTFHANADEAKAEVDMILEYYRHLAEDWLAVPVIAGRKSQAETFAGAQYTLSIEGMMRDGLALQMGTSHYFGQNFARAYDISFSNTENVREHCYTTSWGTSTRLIGGLVMAHGDDSGLIVPPKIGSVQVVVVPIHRDAGSREVVEQFIASWVDQLKSSAIRHKIDWRDERPGEKFAHWELRGVPIRVEVGPRDAASGQVVLVDRLTRQKESVPVSGIGKLLADRLDAFQAALFERARKFQADHTIHVSDREQFLEFFRNGNGFAFAPWCARPECEAGIKAATGGVTTRNMPQLLSGDYADRCVYDGEPATTVAVFARSY
jgi:prolyl-tRNA synthetase